jgi:lipopolysaccharide/colanic/teichoic acid biosynthesis glycosyltransferase
VPGIAEIRINELAIRMADVVISALALLMLLPLLTLIAGLIKLDSSGPVFFRQARLGRGGAQFSIFKFRTMANGAEEFGLKKSTAHNDNRITHIGRLLRNWSIDEIPQLLNIIKGEMSIVGPRPAFPEHLEVYTGRQKRRLEVLPGLTGWAQVNGRNSLSWPARIEHDLWYVEHRSLKLNLIIMWRTIPVLFNTDLIYGPVANFELVPEPVAEPAPSAANPFIPRTAERFPDSEKEKIPLSV